MSLGSNPKKRADELLVGDFIKSVKGEWTKVAKITEVPPPSSPFGDEPVIVLSDDKPLGGKRIRAVYGHKELEYRPALVEVDTDEEINAEGLLTGETLYEMYLEELGRSLEVTELKLDWDTMPDGPKSAWNELAMHLEDMIAGRFTRILDQAKKAMGV